MFVCLYYVSMPVGLSFWLYLYVYVSFSVSESEPTTLSDTQPDCI